jgi:hypothetical protein
VAQRLHPHVPYAMERLILRGVINDTFEIRYVERLIGSIRLKNSEIERFPVCTEKPIRSLTPSGWNSR